MGTDVLSNILILDSCWTTMYLLNYWSRVVVSLPLSTKWNLFHCTAFFLCKILQLLSHNHCNSLVYSESTSDTHIFTGLLRSHCVPIKLWFKTCLYTVQSLTVGLPCAAQSKSRVVSNWTLYLSILAWTLLLSSDDISITVNAFRFFYIYFRPHSPLIISSSLYDILNTEARVVSFFLVSSTSSKSLSIWIPKS